MRLTQHSDNALRCLTYLALHPKGSVKVADMARQMAMSPGHVFKVVKTLVMFGYVETQRGRGGGVRLARDARDIHIGQVILATEGTFDLVECFADGASKCPIAPRCALAGTLNRALGAFLSVLDTMTLADVVTDSQELVQLLAKPATVAA